MINEIRARYWFETPYSLEKAAEVLAGEQSSGTFLKIPGESPELTEKYRAKVLSLQALGHSNVPSLPVKGTFSKYFQAELEISWPLHNMGVNLANVMATVAGNLFELKEFSGLKLLDIDLPADFTRYYRGPKFGITGTRQITGIFSGPIIGTIIKPSVGLSPGQTAAQTQSLIEAGLDFLKDDELMGDSPHSPFEERVSAVMQVIHRFADKTGRKPMFAFNISGDPDDMRRRHDFVVQMGGTCVMVNLFWVGLTGLLQLAEYSAVPVHGHRNGWGLMYRCPHVGIEFPVWQKIWRLAGVDHLHTNGIRNKFSEDDDSVIRSILACQKNHPTIPVMPVLSSGQWAGQIEDTYRLVGNADVMYVCGGGIVGHPGGLEAGVRSVRQAWEAAISGVPVRQFAESHPELRNALDFFK